MNIFCLGRNYAAHAAEMNAEVPKTPMIFIKPSSAFNDTPFVKLPTISDRVDHEVEIVLKMKHGLQGKVSEEDAKDAIAGWAVGIDFTARDLQEVAKKKGMPWALSKGLPGFATVGPFVKQVSFPLSFELKVNGALKQKGISSDMIFDPIQTIQYLANTFTLAAGDIIFTGTPEGVGIICQGDFIEARLIGHESQLKITVS